MNTAGLCGALLGGVIGTVAWAALAVFTGYEVGAVAWAIGGVVGFAAVRMGGRGAAMAAAAAGISLASIFFGKVVTNQLILGQGFDEVASLTQAEYDEAVSDAEALSLLDSPERHREFMVERGFSDAETPRGVKKDELESFRRYHVPVLERLHDEKLDLDAWRSAVRENAFQDVSVLGLVFEDLDFVDILFALFGLGTAYGLVMRASGESKSEKRDEAAGVAGG